MACVLRGVSKILHLLATVSIYAAIDKKCGRRVRPTRYAPLLPDLGTRLWVLELFAVYATDGQTDGQKQRLLPPSLRAGT